MRKTILSLLLLFVATTMNAQGVLKGDMDGDGKLSITDVTALVNAVLSDVKEYIDVFAVDNSNVVGTWYAPNGMSFTFNNDGTTDYSNGNRYEYRPFLGQLTIYDTNNNVVKSMKLKKVAPEYLLEESEVNGALTYYTNSAYLVTGITLSQTTLTLTTGSSLILTATVAPSTAFNTAVTWSSSDTSVATVDQTGQVIANSAGTCEIICAATDGSGITGTCTVTVRREETYVDLGLPSGTLWAECNIGAENPEDYGDYFAWGETVPFGQEDMSNNNNYVWNKRTSYIKKEFVWKSYKWSYGGSETTMSKYCTNNSYGHVDNKTELELTDDAANANWSGDWCMPSEEQFQELINSDYTTTLWTTQNGVNGLKITSNENGNSIFLPAAGYYDSDLHMDAGSGGSYWSLSLCGGLSYSAYQLRFNSNRNIIQGGNRYTGLTIRPVRLVKATSITLSPTPLTLIEGYGQTLTATFSPSNTTNQSLTWSSSNTSVATVDQSGYVSSVASGSCTITCSAADGSGVSATCTVTVWPVSGTIGGHAYVDLDLPSEKLWAMCNIGADSPEGYGDYFAWGETTGYNSGKTVFSWSTYKWCRGSEEDLTRYCNDQDLGFNDFHDNLTGLKLEDDAASVNWGSNWYIPSEADFRELINSSYTTTTWTTLNGVFGRLITSKSNGNSLFLPAAGYRDGSSLNGVGSYGDYWSRSLYTSEPYNAYILAFGSFYVNRTDSERFNGFTIRPVHGDL